jgi:IS30 family transposase
VWVSKKTLIAYAPSKHVKVVTDAIVKLLLPGKAHLHTMPFDNGKEFSYHAQIKDALEVDNYFAHPYHSWELGLNENHNGLIRQYLPKGMALDKVTDEEIVFIQNKLNNGPRKSLGYETPNGVYDAMRLVE